MAKPNKLNPGDRVAYAARFLREQRVHTGRMPARRGTFVSYDPSSPTTHARVKWDDFDAKRSAAQWGDDYVVEVQANGEMVAIHAIARVGDPRYALNDL